MAFATAVLRQCRTGLSWVRGFRSNAALEALAKASEERIPNVVLYNYPSFSGAFSALFARLFHSQLNLPCLILPFSSVEPLRVIGFDHRKSVLGEVPKDCHCNLMFHVDVDKSSSTAAYEYFSAAISEVKSNDGDMVRLLNSTDQDRVEMVLKYIEDGDLRRLSLGDIKAFNIGLGEWRSKLNCITNPHMYEQLPEISAVELINTGSSYISARRGAANILLDMVFKVRLGRGVYGECLGVRVNRNSDLSDEIGKELSLRSAAAGLRSIGAVIYMQRNNLKMCLRSTDRATDTSEVAKKAYGGGGSPCSSSFMIRMDEYNQWLCVQPQLVKL
ncbi:hypothetical protein RJ639_006800 [Escallonia herrerae]|uniref:Uncharacterized protein n=1 Tax=Escallonia herrerae TaxID=1293975 RepID=A0AA89ATZ7_9ASTE|nr:hypothetical protein RJ639_006800 [Escallonia herrerae]